METDKLKMKDLNPYQSNVNYTQQCTLLCQGQCQAETDAPAIKWLNF